MDLSRPRLVEHPEEVSPDSSCWMECDGEGETRRDCRVEGVAALPENVVAREGSEGLLACDGRMFGYY